MAIVQLSSDQPDWSAGKVSAYLQADFPGLQERVVAEVRKVVGCKHAKRRGGELETRGLIRERLRIGACGFVLGAWYRGRYPAVPARQFLGVAVNSAGQLSVMYRLPDRTAVYRTTFQSWRKWQLGRLDAAGCRSLPGIGLSVQVPQDEPVECEAA
jgi:hypothetical protein